MPVIDDFIVRDWGGFVKIENLRKELGTEAMRSAGKYLRYREGRKLDNSVNDVTYGDMEELRADFEFDAEENKRITEASYEQKPYFPSNNVMATVFGEYTYQNPKTEGQRLQYPHGVILTQADYRHYYRGENHFFEKSESNLCRKLSRIDDENQRELYRLVADMRIYEFKRLLYMFDYVQKWKYSEVLHECIAQHYGLETSWLDITTDYYVAMFMATCFWKDGKWFPLTKNETEQSERARYGMLFHCPSWQVKSRWNFSLQSFAENKPCSMPNLIYPIGYQPFMRCHMQHGYAIYMRESQPLQADTDFEKLRFRQDEELSKRIFDMMDGGDKIYPHEGMTKILSLVDEIKTATDFSEDSLRYAVERSHKYSLSKLKEVKNMLRKTPVDGLHIQIGKSKWHLSNSKKKMVEKAYEGFSLEKAYGVQAVSRPAVDAKRNIVGKPMYEPYMMCDVNEKDCAGRVDFKPRKMVEANMWSVVHTNLMKTLVTGSAADYE